MVRRSDEHLTRYPQVALAAGASGRISSRLGSGAMVSQTGLKGQQEGGVGGGTQAEGPKATLALLGQLLFEYVEDDAARD